VCVVGTALVRSTPGLLAVGDVSLAIGAPHPSSYRTTGTASSTTSSPHGKAQRKDHGSVSMQGTAVPRSNTVHGPRSASSRGQGSTTGFKAQNPYLRFVTSVSSIPAGLVIPHDVSLHVVLKVIGEARRGLQNMRQSLLFAGAAQVRCCIRLS
jgi:hypothetical protein